MRTHVGLIGKYSNKTSQDFDFTILKSKVINTYPENIEKIRFYLKEYKAYKRGLRHDISSAYTSLDAFVAYLRKECIKNISNNEQELANYAIDVTYENDFTNLEFAWKMFPNGILENIIENSSGIIRIPEPDPDGNINYLWNRYSVNEYKIEELYEK